MTLYGWDCSDFDWSRGPVNLQDAYNDGIRLFTHKATEGTRVRHHRLGEAMARARAAGIPYLGAYIVPRTPGNGGNGTIAAQVSYYLDYVTTAVPWWRDHPGWFWQIDLEHWSNSSGVYDAVQPRYAVEVSQRLEATGRPRILYAPRWAYGDTIGGSDPLWSSAYGSNPAVHYREAYTGAGGDKGPGWAAYSGRTPLVWQYGSRTRIGSQPQCDANAIRDERAWKDLFPKETFMAALSDTEQQEMLTLLRQLMQGTGGVPAEHSRQIIDGDPTVPDPGWGNGLGLNQLHGKVDKLTERLDQLAAAPAGVVDLDAAIDRALDRLAARLGATPQQQSGTSPS